jgi:dihydroflavonol-4-reductase
LPLQKKILVIGAGGFLGSHLLKHLITQEPNAAIYATYRSNKPTINIPNVKLIPLDLLDVDSVYNAHENMQEVYHCANAVSFDNSDAAALMHNNVEGTANVINACLANKVNKLIYVSSVGAIGRESGDKLINENTPWNTTAAVSIYAQSKYKAELEVWRGQAEGLNTCIVNPSIILGEGNWNNSSCALFKKAYESFAYYTNGANGFVDVKDCATAMHLLMTSNISNQRFILNGINTSYKNIFTLMANAMQTKAPNKLAKPWMSSLMVIIYGIRKLFTGKKSLITTETARTAHSIYKYDNAALLQALPMFNFTPIEQTIQRACKYYISEYGLPKL